ncbi:MAG: prohibitin family protein [Gemmatimonadetes bacterium]|nr:prohibitin family protein [Gemmatimonadota bacterium]
MGLTVIALLVILAGAALWGLAPTTRGPVVTKLAGYGVMAVGVLLAFLNTVTFIDVGEVGVKHFLGRVDDVALTQGVHLINPFADVEKMSVREQSFPPEGGVEQIEAQTSEQLNVNLEVSLLYRFEPTKATELFQRIGTEDEIKQRIVLNAVRNGVRDAIATKSINDIFSPNRRELASAMREAIQAKAGDRIQVIEVFVREIQAPARVREAIEVKLEREQQVSAESFQTEVIQERARQKVEEAKGIAEAQRIISEGLTPGYLAFYYIEQLAKLPAGSVVYVPTEGGVPLIRPLGGGRPQP